MAVAPTRKDLAGQSDADDIRAALAGARRRYYEDPTGALAEAVSCHAKGRSLSDAGLCARARALQGAVSLHRGDLQGALALAVEAERYSADSSDPAVRVEVAALRSQLSFFTGSYAQALREAERSVQAADASGDFDLRIYARRATCLVFGNVGVKDWKERLDEVLALTLEAGDLWEEAISRNDIACYLQETGELEAAEREIARGLEVLDRLREGKNFARAILHSTRADIRLTGGRATEALDDARLSIRLLSESGEPNPYVLGVTVRAEVQARMALGQLDGARQAGEGALAWLGDRVPQTRSLILTTLAEALRETGLLEEAYDALARASELERQAFRELAELQLSLERATLEAHAARRESDALAAKNRQLAEAHAELARRTAQLEDVQEQLREQADRDWLTGLHNRRYLARELERLAHERPGGPLGLAVLDIDHFKAINDRFGHAAGDEVLVRVAGRLCEVLRTCDLVIRSGGEEFLIVMPTTGLRAAKACCERVRRAISGDDWNLVAPGLTLTASVGLACTHYPDDIEHLIKLADQRLYEAKTLGRDRVVGPTELD